MSETSKSINPNRRRGRAATGITAAAAGLLLVAGANAVSTPDADDRPSFAKEDVTAPAELKVELNNMSRDEIVNRKVIAPLVKEYEDISTTYGVAFGARYQISETERTTRQSFINRITRDYKDGTKMVLTIETMGGSEDVVYAGISKFDKAGTKSPTENEVGESIDRETISFVSAGNIFGEYGPSPGNPHVSVGSISELSRSQSPVEPGYDSEFEHDIATRAALQTADLINEFYAQ